MVRGRVETGVSPVGEARSHPKENQLKGPGHRFFTQLRGDILKTVGVKYYSFSIPSRKIQLFLTTCWENTDKYAYWQTTDR